MAHNGKGVTSLTACNPTDVLVTLYSAGTHTFCNIQCAGAATKEQNSHMHMARHRHATTDLLIGSLPHSALGDAAQVHRLQHGRQSGRRAALCQRRTQLCRVAGGRLAGEVLAHKGGRWAARAHACTRAGCSPCSQLRGAYEAHTITSSAALHPRSNGEGAT